MKICMFQVLMLNFQRVMRKKSSWLSLSWIWRIEGTKIKVTRGRGQISVMEAREADDKASLEFRVNLNQGYACVIFVIFSDFQFPRIGSQYFFQRSKVITLHHAERGWRICWPLHPQVSHSKFQPLHHWTKIILKTDHSHLCKVDMSWCKEHWPPKSKVLS